VEQQKNSKLIKQTKKQRKQSIMRFSISAITLLSVILQKSTTFAFTPNSIIGSASTTSTTTTSSSTTALYMAGEEKKKLTAADILAKARKAVNKSQGADDQQEEEEEPEPDFLFEDDILEEFQKSLIILEKRVKEGPSSLSVEEVTALEASTTLIVKDMEDHLNKGTYVKRDSPFAGTKGDATIAAGVAPPPPVVSVPPPPPPVAAVTPSPPTPPPVIESQEEEKPLQYAETSDEEGEAYAGKGGLGMAKGTRNTYVIPGMDEMNPEEYRAALQKSVSDRQRKRRENRDGLVGNRAALQYLDQLGYGGAADNWKTKEEDDTTDTNESVQGSSKKKMERMSKPSEYRTIAQQPNKAVEVPKTSYDSYTVPPETDLYEQPSHSETHALVDKVLEEEGPKLQYAETSDEEGEAYNGKGGLGMAKGTRNTYVIPGMDEMSPEEYRAALQKSVSDRQRKRRQNRDGLVGNRAALQYLDQLGYGGAADNWKTKEDGGADE
jgi:hypothetical protein